MRTTVWIALAGSLGLAGTALAQQPPPGPNLGHTAKLALQLLPPSSPTPLTVTSPAFHNGGQIPLANTQYGQNIFPGLVWTRGPAATRTYVVIIQGAPYGNSPTSIQMVLYNVPARLTRLRTGLSAPPPGAAFGPNVHGPHQPYAGPHTHTGAQHLYHIEVFALDTRLQVPSTVSFDALVAAMSGHVLASGDLTAYTAKPPGRVYKPNHGV